MQTLRDKELILLLEKNIRGGISSVMGDRYEKMDGYETTLYVDSTNLYGWARSQMLPNDEIEMRCGHPGLYVNKLEEILNTPNDSDIGYSVEVI